MVYYFMLAITMIVVTIYSRKDNSKVIERICVSKRVSIIIGIALVLFAGLRSYSVGADTLAYLYHFNNVMLTPFDALLLKYRYDIGFYYFTWFISHITKNYTIYLLLIEAIYIFSVSKFIESESTNQIWSYFIFFCFALYTFSFSTIRQTLAISYCLLSYISFKPKEKKWILSACLLVLASMFHKSAVIFVMFYFAKIIGYNMKMNKKIIAVIIISPIILTLASSRIINILEENTEKKYAHVSVGGTGMVIFLVFCVICGIWCWMTKNQKAEIDKRLSSYTILIYFAVAIFAITRVNKAIMRLYLYYLPFLMVFIPTLIQKIKGYNKLVLASMFSFVSIYFWINNVMASAYSDASLLLPYSIVWFE